MIWYHVLHKLNVYKVAARPEVDNGSKLAVCFYFTDGDRFVCHATARPFMKNRRTGDWMSIVTLGISTGCEFTMPLKQMLKGHVEELAAEVIDILMGDG